MTNRPHISLQRGSRAAQLRASEQRYRRLFETAQDGILILDAESGRVLDANPFMTTLLGYSQDELIGKQLWQLGLFQDIALAKDAFSRLQKSGYARYEDLPLETKDGQVKEVEFVSNSYRSDGDFVIQCNIRDMSERTAARRQLMHDATTDFLTGVANRRHFQQLAEQELYRSWRYSHRLSVLVMDIDHFKCINDEHGHRVGDLVLQAFAACCVSELRDIDILGRVGGEEFCVLLPETNAARSAEVAERLRCAVSALRVDMEDGSALGFTVSIGVATLDDQGHALTTIFDHADAKLYEAKHAGRNRVCA